MCSLAQPPAPTSSASRQVPFVASWLRRDRRPTGRGRPRPRRDRRSRPADDADAFVGAEHGDRDARRRRRTTTSAIRASPAHAYSAGSPITAIPPGSTGASDPVVPARGLERDVVRAVGRQHVDAPAAPVEDRDRRRFPGRSSPTSANATRACVRLLVGSRRCTRPRIPSVRPSVACACSRRAARPTTPARRTRRDRSRRRARRAARARRRRGTSAGSARRRPRRCGHRSRPGPADSAASNASTSRVVGARRGVEHVLVRPQPEGARHHVGVQEPGPQHLGPDQVAVVAARADRRHVAQPARLREVGGRRHAPLRVQVARAERGVDAFLPRRGAARARADRARRGSTRSASRARTPRRPRRRPGRAAARTARRPADARGRRRSTSRTRRRTATATTGAGSARRAAAGRVARAARRCRREARRRAAPNGPCPLGGTTHSSVSNGRSTSCGYHHESSCTAPTGTPRASRSSTAATIVEAASRPGSVRYQYALPLSVQYDSRVPSTSASRAGAAHARRRSQQSRPAREAVARAVARDDRELGGETGGHVVDVAVPARAQARAGLLASGGHDDDLLVKRPQRREQHRAAVGRDETERHDDRRAERQQPPPRHRRVAEHGQRELRVLVTERPQTVGRAAVGPALRIEVPRDRRRREIARRDAAPRFARFQPQHHDRLVREHAGATDDPAGVDRQPACRCRGPRRRRSHPA